MPTPAALAPPGWMSLFGADRDALGHALAQAEAPALEAAWMVEVQRRPHDAERHLRRHPQVHPAERALLSAAIAQQFDDPDATLHGAAQALAYFSDPLDPRHLWALALRGLGHLESGWPERALQPLQAALRGADRDRLHWLQLDALRSLARAHDERGDGAAADALIAQGLHLAQARGVPAGWATHASLRRLALQRDARAATPQPLRTLPSPAEPSLADRLVQAQQQLQTGDAATAAATAQALSVAASTQYLPLKWQVELAELCLRLRLPEPTWTGDTPSTRHGLHGLHRVTLGAFRGAAPAALAETLAARGLQRALARLQLAQANSATALGAWWQHPARDAGDVLALGRSALPWVQARAASTLVEAERRFWRSSLQRLVACHRAAPQPAAPGAPPPELTAREWDVLRLIGQDWANAQIAARLGVSEATVKTHINRLYAKLALRSRREARLQAQLWSGPTEGSP